MRKFFIFFCLSLVFVSLSYADVHRVGTYNLRWPSSGDVGEKSWGARHKTVYTMIRDTMNFDVVALQEVTTANGYNMYDSIKKYLSDEYSFRKKSGVVLAYRKSKYNCLESGDYALQPSPLPQDWGKDWENRYVVWAKLQDKTSKEVLVFGATHLDVNILSLREGARICSEKMHKIAGTDACVVTGDLNCEPGDRDPHGYYKQYFGNARELTQTAPKGSYYTFSSSMDPGVTEGRKLIDYLYVRNVEVESYWANNSTLGRTWYPSDHLPVMCEVTILPQSHPSTHVVTNVDELRQAAAAVQPEEIIYLRDGVYDLGDSTLHVANTCVIEASPKAVLTGATQLIKGNTMIALDIRGLTIKNATCPSDITLGSLLFANGNYLKLSNCTIQGCSTLGNGLIYTEDCNLTIDHCLFQDNEAEAAEGCVSVHNGLSALSYTCNVTNSTFRNNRAFRAPALYTESKHTAYLSCNSFVGNQSQERGCVAIVAPDNTTDIRLVNNTFINNTISVESSFFDYYVGGTAIWQEMAGAGCLTLVHNTIVGNHAACWIDESTSSEDFWGGAVQSESGQMKVYNNIIAGNYSSASGRGDVSLSNPNAVVGQMHNVFSSEDNTNFPLSISDIAASDYAAACQSLVSLLGGSVQDNRYYAPIQTYGDANTIALQPLTTQYAGEDIAIVDAEARMAATIQSDILNKGTLTGTLTTDQVGATRQANSVPGAMEVTHTPGPVDPYLTITRTAEQIGTEYNWETGSFYDSFVLGDVITYRANQPQSGKLNGYYSPDDPRDWRMYQARNNGEFSVSALPGYLIHSLSFEYSTTKSGVLSLVPGSEVETQYQVASGQTIVVDTSFLTFYAGNTTADSVGQVRISQFTVTYYAIDPAAVAERFTLVAQTKNNDEEVTWQGDYADWQVLNVRRAGKDTLNHQVQATWMKSGGYIKVADAEGGIKRLRFAWRQFVTQPVELALALSAGDVWTDTTRIQSIAAQAQSKDYCYDTLLQCKQNVPLSFSNVTVMQIQDQDRFLIGDIFITPYIYVAKPNRSVYLDQLVGQFDVSTLIQDNTDGEGEITYAILQDSTLGATISGSVVDFSQSPTGGTILVRAYWNNGLVFSPVISLHISAKKKETFVETFSHCTQTQVSGTTYVTGDRDVYGWNITHFARMNEDAVAGYQGIRIGYNGGVKMNGTQEGGIKQLQFYWRAKQADRPVHFMVSVDNQSADYTYTVEQSKGEVFSFQQTYDIASNTTMAITLGSKESTPQAEIVVGPIEITPYLLFRTQKDTIDLARASVYNLDSVLINNTSAASSYTIVSDETGAASLSNGLLDLSQVTRSGNIQVQASWGQVTTTIMVFALHESTDLWTPYLSGEGRGEAVKMLHNGRLVIYHNGRLYNPLGNEIR